jgi:5'-nucleotidase
MMKPFSKLRAFEKLTVALGAISLVAACAGEPPRPEAALAPSPVIRLQVLALNDFHGQLVGREKDGRKVGGAAVLKAYLDRERGRFDGETLIVQSGDLVGASSPESALPEDEPTIMFMNSLANAHCGKDRDPRCNLVGTLGNHELDEGEDELLRLIRGGPSPKGPFLEDPFIGSTADTISANVVDTRTEKTMFPPFAIKRIGGVAVAFVAATAVETALLVRPEMIRRTRFLDEAAAINETVEQLRREGVRAFVVLLHAGGEQTPYEGATRKDAGEVTGRIVSIVGALDGEVDVVISGHTHEFTNALLPNAGGRDVLVTQAFSDGRAYADIELELDARTGDVIGKSAVIETTWADAVTQDRETEALIARALAIVGPRLSREIGRLSAPATRDRSLAGESTLGDLVADAQRQAVSADVAFMNPGGLRADLAAGLVTLQNLLEVHPFGNTLVVMTLTGAQIAALLEQQWQEERARILQVSGVRYAWSETSPRGARVREIEIGGAPLDPHKRYTVAVNDFLAEGGDGFTIFAQGQERRNGPLDIEALESYLASSEAPLEPPSADRIRF